MHAVREFMSAMDGSSYDDFLSCNVGTLKDFLQLRGLAVTGSKAELVARAFAACEFKLPLIISNEEQAKRLQSEYHRRLSAFGLPDPKDIEEEEWTDSVEKWPCVDLGKVFSYILSHKEFDSEYIGKYKDQKAYSYWKSNFVDAILYTKCGRSCFVKCKVTPSQSVRQEPREVWIAIENDGTLLCGWCTCIAGTSAACNHIIATLYKLEYACAQGYNDPSCTSLPCGWNKSTKKDIAPSKIMELMIRKDKRTRDEAKGDNPGIISESWKQFDPRRDGQRERSETRMQEFVDKYQFHNPNAVLFKTLEKSDDSDEILELRPLEEIANTFAQRNKDLSGDDLISSFMESLCINQESAKKLEERTRGQATNKTWFQQRKGRITASVFKDVHIKVDRILKSRDPNARPKTTPLVVKLLYEGKDLGNVPAIKWGREHEEQALREFHAKALVSHKDCRISKCGLYILKNKPYIGASPDGLMTCSCCGTVVLEIKCPFSIRDNSISETFAQTNFLELVDGKITLKKSHSYYYQIIGQMAASGCEKGYFIVWTTKSLFFELIGFDRSLWDKVERNLDLFFKAYVLKVMLGIESICFCPSCDKPVLEKEELSETEKEEESVCCDHCGCWFHFKCVNVKNIHPDSEWLCGPCLTSITADDIQIYD